MQLRRGMMSDYASGYEAGMKRGECPMFRSGYFKAGFARGRQERYRRDARPIGAERARGR